MVESLMQALKLNTQKKIAKELRKVDAKRWTQKAVAKSRTYQLMSASETLDKINSTIVEFTPESESQWRELEPVPKTQLPEVWQQVCDSPNNVSRIKDGKRQGLR
jgi:hypothetical protein